MLNSINFSKLLLSFFMVLLLGYNSHAQLTIINETDCQVRVKTAESDGCTTCNSSDVQALVPNGGSYTHPFAGCPDPWLAVKFRAATFTTGGVSISSGVSYNPGIICGTDVPATCNGDVINVTWSILGNVGEVILSN